MNEQQLLFGEWTVYFVKQKCDEQGCHLSGKMTSLKVQKPGEDVFSSTGNHRRVLQTAQSPICYQQYLLTNFNLINFICVISISFDL